MAFTSAHVTELQTEEKRCLDKMTARKKHLMRDDPRLSQSAAYCRAVAQLPNCYDSYCSVRRQLAALGISPLQFDKE